MAKVDLIVKNGTVVTPTSEAKLDVAIDGGKFVAIAAPGTLGLEAKETYDATGKYVIPGGIDVHTHLDLPLAGTVVSDDFESGTRAAAWGGVTTVVDMANQEYEANVFDGLAEWHEKAAGKCAVDYSFTMMISSVNDFVCAVSPSSWPRT